METIHIFTTFSCFCEWYEKQRQLGAIDIHSARAIRIGLRDFRTPLEAIEAYCSI